MKYLKKVPTAAFFAVLGLLGIAGVIIYGGVGNMVSPSSLSATAISANLSSAGNFSVLAALSMSAAGPGTVVSGDLGLSPGLAASKTGPWTVGGAEYFGVGGVSANAQADALSAFNNLAGQTSDGLWAGSTSPAPGVWTEALDTTFTGTLTLTGSYTDVWVFQIGRDMTFSGSIVMAGTAQSCNVFFQVGRDATIAAGAAFKGTIIASRDITLVSAATVDGRVMSLNGALTTDGNTISGPTCVPAPTAATLTVIKHVITDNGGTATASDWNLTVASSNGGTGTGSATGTEIGTAYTLETGKQYSVTESGGPGGYLISGSADCAIASAVVATNYTCTITNDDIAPQLIVTKTIVNLGGGTKLSFPLFIGGIAVTSGVINTTTVGAHTVSETADPGYTASVWGGNCASDGTITLGLGDLATCTITNTFIIPSVSGGGGGGGGFFPVPPLIDVVKVPTPLALPNGPGSVTYTYTLRNVGTVSVGNITMVGDSCSPLKLISGDSNGDGHLAVNETWIYTCTTTLSATHTNTVTAIGWANGISATDIASATVVVGVPIVPPLIHVTKIPNPLVLLGGQGAVTYTNKVTNPGTTALSNIRLVDDKCSPVQYISGDTNNDALLGVTETWIYTCRTNLVATTTNIVTASGDANGLTAKDFAIATVVVSTPALPNTGFSPEK